MPAWGWLILVCAALIAVHRLALWMEARGWIYWTRSRGWSSRAGNAFLELQQLLDPSRKHVLEMKTGQKQNREQDRSGAPPPASGPDGAAPHAARRPLPKPRHKLR